MKFIISTFVGALVLLGAVSVFSSSSSESGSAVRAAEIPSNDAVRAAKKLSMPSEISFSKATGLTCRWSVGMAGGTVSMTMGTTGPTFTREGGQEEFASMPCDLHPDLASATEEAPPQGPHMNLVVTEYPGGSVASFVVANGPGVVMTRVTNSEFVKFFNPVDELAGAGIVPAVGALECAYGEPVTVTIRGCHAPVNVGMPWHIGKQTQVTAAGMQVTRYFIKPGN